MPSPFPGMDPYLEAPALWPDFHHEMISGIREKLNSQLRPKYHAMVEERVYISDENDPGRSTIIPDVVIQSRTQASRNIGPTAGNPDVDSEIAVAEPIMATTMFEEEIHEARVVIVDADGRQVVAVIEVLGPANKIVGSRGRADYESKRLDVLQSPAHYIEIDLLREGVPIYSGERIPKHDYCVHVSRKGDRPRGIIWPILLTQRLPKITIPLLPKDPDAELDLEQVLNTAYDRAGYDMVVDYRKPPIVPLIEPSASWARTWLDKNWNNAIRKGV